MFRAPLRLAGAALLLLTIAGCGGSDSVTPTPNPNPNPTPNPTPTPTATLSVASPTATVAAGSTAAIAVTLTRGNGFTGDVSVTAGSLPTGITASTAVIAAGSTTGTVTLTAAANAPAASAVSATITGTGTGVTITPVPLALTVTPAGNGAVISLAASAGSIEAGGSGTLAITVTRTGTFAGAVTVNATSLPNGVTTASQTVAAGATSATLTFTSNLGAALATTALSVTATASGITIAPQPYALTVTAGPIAQLGNDMTSSDGQFGSNLALNADGTRLVVSAATTANGTTRVYQRTGSTWAQLGGDIIGEASGDRAGTSVAINAAGTRIAIGAYLNDDNGSNAGHIRVYDLVGSTWTQVGADIDGDSEGWGFGWSVALSASGSRLIGGAARINSTLGRAKVYDLVGSTWTQVGNTLEVGDEFADDVDISGDGSTIAASSPSASGSSRAGTVQVFRLVGSDWTQVGDILRGEQIGDVFGTGLSLSANGNRIAVAAPSDSEGGVSGGGGTAGKVRVFELTGGSWVQLGGDILGAAGLNGERLGEQLTLSDDGTRLAANGASQAVAKVFTLTGGTWTQTGPTITAYGSATRSEGLAMARNGRSVAVGYVNGTPRIARVFSIAP